MTPFLTIIVMIIIGAIIGGVTNMIAVKMLFHPFKAYYIFGKRMPFTPGLIPKRREEIATKIGQVVEEHLLTESLIREKLNSKNMISVMDETIHRQVELLRKDETTLQTLAEHLNIDVAEKGTAWITQLMDQKLTLKYLEHEHQKLTDVIPASIVEKIDQKIETVSDILLARAKAYLNSDKGYTDILDMLESFFVEKGKIIGMLQMFMTQEAIAERIQIELLRLTEQPKAQHILKEQIQKEYNRLKRMPLCDIVDRNQFNDLKHQMISYSIFQVNLSKRVHQPVSQVFPDLFNALDDKGVRKISQLVISLLANRLTSILKQVNIRGLVEEQINRFELDYIERLIFEIANKELKLIMLLGFVLGGIVGLFQGLIAIFV
ncbi:DUF445 domain-containing protein [Staphylococcus felis]|uniref:DUF445 domain-containing protein n=1 Tax=Staphylococcus felis TaxID=46127 RepID=UPI000E274AEE|nr:DUF445 family protein [Staphylococcus felis]REH94092.1 DUF445 domain-containing protein [Staphylococcus felis]REI06065.1 DUF445 domain-containing protein [Staphylococcus felis]REI18165.1 DUF445 domain-containing protein [Staphylococcus felis]REI20412.1 DUF445 domain-containing protein [Staphylococcus felis]REI27672.1 DUF445 domain-containing protein [Staphylococcus felis]